MSAYRFKKRIVYLLVMAVLIPLALEAGARVIYVVRLHNFAYLHYPKNAPLAMNTIISQAVSDSFTPAMKLPPGPHQFIVGGNLLHEIMINDSGFRGKDFTDPKPAKRRIVTMGGSSTFSSEAPEGTSYPEVMEELLNEQYGQSAVEVINRGMNGFATTDVADLLVKDVAKHPVDLVTICSAFNAANDPVLIDLRKGRAPFIRRALWGRSLFYTALLNSRLSKKYSGAQEPEQVERRYRENLERIIETAKKNRFALMFILQPMLDTDRIQTALIKPRTQGEDLSDLLNEFKNKLQIQRRLGEVMKQVGALHGVPVVDPRPALENAPDPSRYFWICLHLTDAGSKVMAEQIVLEMNEKFGGLEKVISNKLR